MGSTHYNGALSHLAVHRIPFSVTLASGANEATPDSDIIHLNLAGTSVIVLSSFKAMEELFEKRSSIYSDRYASNFRITALIYNFRPTFPMSPRGTNFYVPRRIHRRLFSQQFNKVASHSFRHTERVAAHALLRRLLRDPGNFLGHIRQMAGEFILSVAYGIDALPVNDPYISLAAKTVKSVSNAAVPGRFLVDSLPILKYVPEWFPGAHFKGIAREGKLLSQALRDVPFAEAKRRMTSGASQSCFTVNALRDVESGGQSFEESTVKDVAAVIYAGGADTTVSALSTFILAMLANPEAQKKAQREIDSVEGMPYVAAVVKEVLRWKNVIPFGVPHFLAVDDKYRGYHLPAAPLVIGNTWAILHDEIPYPDPYTFKPERFLLDRKLNPAVKDPQAAFGFGRRICPGRHVATSSIWITIVSVLAMFNITEEVGEDGHTVEPSYEYEGGIIRYGNKSIHLGKGIVANIQLPFKCMITPRSQDTANTIHATSDEI
ncbi:cytochrome P450 [Mycena leptocephala]|nr:cytochrome P450 [Mycena leptocephala]